MKKILLIEDDVDLFSLLKYNLEKEGFSLSGLQTGKGAVELCRQVRPDLILLTSCCRTPTVWTSARASGAIPTWLASQSSS